MSPWTADLAAIKRQLGDPIPYRLSVIAFWVLGSVFSLIYGCGQQRPPSVFWLLLLVMAPGFYFYARAALRGLSLLFFIVFGWLFRPGVWIRLSGWLLFGNPLRGTLEEKVISVAAIGSLVGVLATSIVTGC